MAIGPCSACDQERHICLAIAVDGEVSDMLAPVQLCETCGAFVAGVLEMTFRTAFKRSARPASSGGES